MATLEKELSVESEKPSNAQATLQSACDEQTILWLLTLLNAPVVHVNSPKSTVQPVPLKKVAWWPNSSNRATMKQTTSNLSTMQRQPLKHIPARQKIRKPWFAKRAEQRWQKSRNQLLCAVDPRLASESGRFPADNYAGGRVYWCTGQCVTLTNCTLLHTTSECPYADGRPLGTQNAPAFLPCGCACTMRDGEWFEQQNCDCSLYKKPRRSPTKKTKKHVFSTNGHSQRTCRMS